MDELKDGILVGTDKYGNKYFENPRYFYGRNRWVEYAPKYGTVLIECFLFRCKYFVIFKAMNYDGSQIPAEWFGWMHYKTDLLPNEVGLSIYLKYRVFF